MKCDLNGWGNLSRQFKSEAHFKAVAAELFGENFDATEVVNENYLLDGKEIAALFEYLGTPLELKRKVLSEIISKRVYSGISTGIAELKQLFCAVYSEVRFEVPCIDLRTLSKFHGESETLHRFIKCNSEKTVDLAIPPFAAVCRINDELSARELSLPCGSLIIIDMVHPAVTDEFCLCLNRSGSFSFGCDTTSDGDLLWKTPVLRLHLIPLQQ